MAFNTSRLTLLPTPRQIRFHGLEQKSASDRVVTSIDPEIQRPEGYRLLIDQDSPISIAAADPAGIFRGRQTLAQLRRQFENQPLPVLTIDDWPDFPVRGFMLDISRDKVPTMASLYALVDLLAELKINQLQLYTEHTFAYREHGLVWKDASPMTGDEIQSLDAYCRERFIELVPNQNSFGHLERWFKHKEYQHLAEQPDGFMFPWGNRMPTGFSLNPTDSRSLAFVESLFDELLPNFSSRLFNVGCDETFDIGLGRSKEAVERRGRERVYLEFVQKIHKAVTSRGRRMMFWGDIILHKPELLSELPKDLIALNWGYEADHPFETETQAFARAGIPFYVCPGTSTWCSIGGRSDNAIANLKSAAKHGLASGAAGYLITDWGDHGHLQYFSTSYLPLAAGAAFAWCAAANDDLSQLMQAVDLHVFQDDSQRMSRIFYDLGNVGLALKNPIKNGSALFWTLIVGEEWKKRYEHVTADEYRAAAVAAEAAIRGLEDARISLDCADLIKAEVRNTAALLKHACRRGLFLMDSQLASASALRDEISSIVAEHERLWLLRNRRGGLSDSAARLRRVRDDYSIV